ncbi:MAG: glycosyltransferase [Anaerolineae bacterium]|nr:glycosyltransferase [Anaerolineae bacterium]
MPEVSIIMPAYNAGRFIGEALESVLRQTFQDFEVIVVDDGSTDDTAEVVARFADPRIRYVYQENRGPEPARNSGLQLAQGNLIAFLDADDLWEPGFLAHMVSYLQAHPHVDGVYCGYRYMQVDGTPLPEVVNRVVPPEDLYETLLEGNFLSTCAVLLRRSVFTKTGSFDETLSHSGDYDMWLRIAANSRLEGVRDTLVWYRRHNMNTTLGLEKQIACHAAIVAKHFGEDVDNPSNWSPHKRLAYAGYYRLRANNALRLGDVPDCAESLAHMLSIRPDWVEQDKWYAMIVSCSVPHECIGEVQALDLGQSTRLVLAALDYLFTLPRAAWLLQHQRKIYANMYCTLARVAYWQGRTAESRKWFFKAISTYPAIMLDTHRSYWMVRYLVGGLLRPVRQIMQRRSAKSREEIVDG